MNVVIIYHSEHHNNTKKLLDGLAAQGGITLMESNHAIGADLSGYDYVGFASGIYYQKFHEGVLCCAKSLPLEGKKVFFLYTCGVKRNSYTDAIREMTESRGAQVLGSFGCPGYDTFGPFKLVGGIAKGRPNETDIAEAAAFLHSICKE